MNKKKRNTKNNKELYELLCLNNRRNNKNSFYAGVTIAAFDVEFY